MARVVFGSEDPRPKRTRKAKPKPPERPTGEVITEGSTKANPQWDMAENSGKLLVTSSTNAILKQPKLNSLKEFVMKAFKEIMNFNFDKFFETIMSVSGMICGVVAVFFIVTGMNTCQKQMNESEAVQQAARNKAIQECIDKTQKPWECRESIR